MQNSESSPFHQSVEIQQLWRNTNIGLSPLSSGSQILEEIGPPANLDGQSLAGPINIMNSQADTDLHRAPDATLFYDTAKLNLPFMSLSSLRDSTINIPTTNTEKWPDDTYPLDFSGFSEQQQQYHGLMTQSPSLPVSCSPQLWNVCLPSVFSPVLSSGHLTYSPLMRVPPSSPAASTTTPTFSLDGPAVYLPTPNSPNSSMGWIVHQSPQLLLHPNSLHYEAARQEEIPRDIRSSLIVSFIPQCWTLTKLLETFKPYGNVLQYRLDDSPNGGHRGRGFIEFDSPEAAMAAMLALSGLAVEEHKRLKVVPKWLSTSNHRRELREGVVRDTSTQQRSSCISEIAPNDTPRTDAASEGHSAASARCELRSDLSASADPSAPTPPSSRNKKHSAFSQRGSTEANSPKRSLAIIPQNNLFIFHVPPSWNEGEFRKQFETFGPIRSLGFPKDDSTPWGHRGYGFICFEKFEDAQDAIREMDGKEVQTGRRLKVEFKKPLIRARLLRKPLEDTTKFGAYNVDGSFCSPYVSGLDSGEHNRLMKNNDPSRFLNNFVNGGSGGAAFDSLLWSPEYPAPQDWIQWPMQISFSNAGHTVPNDKIIG